MKNINGRISLLFDDSGLKIEVVDELSSTCFLEIRLDEKQALQALSRLSRTKCNLKVRGLEKVGLKLEILRAEVDLPEMKNYSSKSEERLFDYVQAEVDILHPNEGWVLDRYISRETINRQKNKFNAICRRWVNA